METEIIKEDSEFCACPGEIRTEVWIPFFDGEKYVSKLDGEPIPDGCPDCRKPIQRETIVVEFNAESDVKFTGKA
jgi:hypothetical protein